MIPPSSSGGGTPAILVAVAPDGMGLLGNGPAGQPPTPAVPSGGAPEPLSAIEPASSDAADVLEPLDPLDPLELEPVDPLDAADEPDAVDALALDPGPVPDEPPPVSEDEDTPLLPGPAGEGVV
jgi:hypothetical protein